MMQKLRMDWGFIIDRITVVLNDNNNPRHRFNVSATITEDFSSMTEEELANAPKIVFEEKTFNFSEVESGEKVSHKYVSLRKSRSQGKSDLIIRKVFALHVVLL